MLITRTPFRISFFGGGTDYPAWFRENGGAVLATTIDKYCYITCRSLPPFFEHKHRIVYSNIENVTNIDQINHPAVRHIFQWAKITEGLEIHHDGDLPARSGLGSSSAFTVGLIHALYGMNGIMVSKERLAKDAINVEQNLIGESVGSQDQISAAFGGLNFIQFNADNSFEVTPLVIPNIRKLELQSHLLLFFTGFSRIANEIAMSKIENFSSRRAELFEIRQMVDDAIEILVNQNIPIVNFGRLLHDSWQLKKSLSKLVSNAELDLIYDAAIGAGAIGGKILGAGGGGFILIFAEPFKHAQIIEKLKPLISVAFDFEYAGSKVVLYQPNGL